MLAVEAGIDLNHEFDRIWCDLLACVSDTDTLSPHLAQLWLLYQDPSYSLTHSGPPIDHGFMARILIIQDRRQRACGWLGVGFDRDFEPLSKENVIDFPAKLTYTMINSKNAIFVFRIL